MGMQIGQNVARLGELMPRLATTQSEAVVAGVLDQLPVAIEIAETAGWMRVIDKARTAFEAGSQAALAEDATIFRLSASQAAKDAKNAAAEVQRVVDGTADAMRGGSETAGVINKYAAEAHRDLVDFGATLRTDFKSVRNVAGKVDFEPVHESLERLTWSASSTFDHLSGELQSMAHNLRYSIPEA